MTHAASDATSSALEQVIKEIAQDAASQILPQAEVVLHDFVVREMAKVSSAVPEVPNTPDINLSDVVHKQQARSVALRSLVSGLGLAVVTGLGTGVAAIAGYDWFTKEGAMASLIIVGTSVLHSIQAYFSQLKVTSGT